MDDEEIIRESLLKILEIKGFKGYSATNGENAIETLKEIDDQIDFLILDLNMPGMSGEETFDRIRELRPEIKIIISTGFANKNEQDQFMKKGAHSILLKPFRFEKLLETLGEE